MTVTQVRECIGQETGLSDWILISQDMIDRFAELTDDHQFIHTDPQRAVQTPFGGTIAHGFLILSMLPKLMAANRVHLSGVKIGVNYGFDKLRLMAPVHAGKRIRGRFVLKDFSERGPGRWIMATRVSVEIEGQDKPAVVGDWLNMLVTA
ncbi:MAG: MaoC family dehydratase [Burkholderiaceae bacterium]